MSLQDGVDSTIAIIGSAGSHGDHEKITPELWLAMIEKTAQTLKEWGIEQATSGGAAFSDHLAVHAFNNGLLNKLTLYLPAYWANSRFIPNPKIRFNPGAAANSLHNKFSQRIGINSLAEIQEAIDKGAETIIFEGFHRRNTEVANKASHVLAFTFGPNLEPQDFYPEQTGFSQALDAGLKEGGTKDTWEKSWQAEKKKHISLTWLAHNLIHIPLGIKI